MREPQEHVPDTEHTDAAIDRRGLFRGAAIAGLGAAAVGAAVPAAAVPSSALTTTTAAGPAAEPRDPSHAPRPDAPADAPAGVVPGVTLAAPVIADCDTWGAEAPRGSISRTSGRPNKILVHHMASGNTTDFSEAAAHRIARSVQQWHFANGWVDSGQHFSVSRGGYVMEGRRGSLAGLEAGTHTVVGAHAPGQNSEAIGIENEGTYTGEAPPAELWGSLVDFCAYICQQYDIAPTQIYGHRDYTATACPGDVFYGMLPQLRSEVAAALGGTSWSVTVDNGDGGFSAGANWQRSSYSAERHGADYHFATPAEVSDQAEFRAEIPSDGTYRVEAWFPGMSGYNAATPYFVHTGTASSTIRVDQSSGGGRWVSLGTYAMTAGTRTVVAVSRWTSGSEYVIADAIRITRL